jgi:hypothetical protein
VTTPGRCGGDQILRGQSAGTDQAVAEYDEIDQSEVGGQVE